ncbi:hypothetical protein L914_04017 [Phytophthora nicotianae]|uniref:Uncharacterized protein n=2 Tax=Phytophthora nicotianae TaxID=4792 RepID=V9FQR2_PHYNI|nr:hypothetical protein F443_04187 [Phytophthora nicotianae P1569]ETM52352.1 hypothetical protein L914_04017 [Phytophthora nicotianae]
MQDGIANSNADKLDRLTTMNMEKLVVFKASSSTDRLIGFTAESSTNMQAESPVDSTTRHAGRVHAKLEY